MDCSTFAFDLHVLGMPPALILSQDQTLKLNLLASATASAMTPAKRFNPKILFIGSSDFFVSSCVRPPHGLRRSSGRQLILDGLCLHVLSSFQRTGIRRSFASSMVFATV